MAGKKAQGAVKKSDILAASLKLFHEKGYEATSIQDVATAVGLLKGSLYHHISSKEELLYEIVTQVLNQLIPKLEVWRSLEGSSLDRLTRFMEEYVLHVIANQESISVMFRDYSALTEAHRAKVIEMQRQYDRFLAELIETGRQDGSIAELGDTRILVNALYGMANWSYLWYRRDLTTTPAVIAMQISMFARRMLSGNER